MGQSYVITPIMAAREVLLSRDVELLTRLDSCRISLNLQLRCGRNQDLVAVAIHHVLRGCLQSGQVQHNGRLLRLWHLLALIRLLDAPGGHSRQLGGAHRRVERCINFVLLAYLFVNHLYFRVIHRGQILVVIN